MSEGASGSASERGSWRAVVPGGGYTHAALTYCTRFGTTPSGGPREPQYLVHPTPCASCSTVSKYCKYVCVYSKHVIIPQVAPAPVPPKAPAGARSHNPLLRLRLVVLVWDVLLVPSALFFASSRALNRATAASRVAAASVCDLRSLMGGRGLSIAPPLPIIVSSSSPLTCPAKGVLVFPPPKKPSAPGNNSRGAGPGA